MQFKPENFRRIAEDCKPPFKIRLADGMPLIFIKGSGAARYGVTRGDKDDIVADFDAASDLLLWAWIGEFSTSIFILTDEDLRQHYR
jgi:hypothetical protein